MRRTLLICLAAFSLSAGTSAATVTRTKTMGRVGNWVQDDGNIFAWPSTVVRFSNRFFLEIGEDDAANASYDPPVGPGFPSGFGGGALYNLNDVHHLGFFVTGNDRSNKGGVSDPYFPDDPLTGLPMEIDDFMTLFYGYAAGDFDMGANVRFGKSRSEQTAPENRKHKASVGRIGFRGGVSWRMANDNLLDVTVRFTGTLITDKDISGTNVEDDGFHTIAARARVFWNYTDDLQFVPYVEFERENRGVRRDSDGDHKRDTDRTETSAIDLAWGINHLPSERIQLIFVGGVRFTSTDLTVQGTGAGDGHIRQVPYLKAGLDVGPWDWIDLRAGVEKQIARSDSSSAGDNAVRTGTSSAGYQGYIGAGFHVGDWTIDTQIDPNIFYRGPNFIGGAQANLNTRVSLVRPW